VNDDRPSWLGCRAIEIGDAPALVYTAEQFDQLVQSKRRGATMSHPSYGAAFIDGSHGQDGFMSVGNDNEDSIYSDDEPENDS
jgi:hypothetical protein